MTTFLTQRQLMTKNMPAAAMTGPYAQQQKMLLYVLPVVFAVGGVAFPIGVLIYWTVSNMWTMGQQFYVIRRNPAPGYAGAKAKEDARRGEGGTQGPSRDAGHGGSRAATATPGRGEPSGRRLAPSRRSSRAASGRRSNPPKNRP